MNDTCATKCLSLLLFVVLLQAESTSGRLWQATGTDQDVDDYVRWLRPPRESYGQTDTPASQLTTGPTPTSNFSTEFDRDRSIVQPILEHFVKQFHKLATGRPFETGRDESHSSPPTKRVVSRRPFDSLPTTTEIPHHATQKTRHENDTPPEVVPDQAGEGATTSCRCVPFYQCVDGKIVKDGAGIIDPRSKSKGQESAGGRSGGSACGPFSICCKEEVVERGATCGDRVPKTAKEQDKSRILSPDGASSFGSWPWQAALLKFDGHVNTFQCGGTLIDNLHILTVAHCVEKFVDGTEDINELIVRLGEYDTGSRSEPLPHEDFHVQRITIHHSFRNTSLWNDIALVRLDTPVTFKPHIEPVCLPDADDRFDGQSCATTGWGQDAYKGGVFSNVLKEAYVPVVDRHSCSDLLRRTRLGTGFRLHDSFLCAGGKSGVDSCRGDGGGPLVCHSGKSFKLAGLVSWGIECGHPDVPGVYVNVPFFVSWIRDHIRSEEDWGQTSRPDQSTFEPVEGSRIALPPVFRRTTPPPANSRSRVGWSRNLR